MEGTQQDGFLARVEAARLLQPRAHLVLQVLKLPSDGEDVVVSRLSVAVQAAFESKL